MTFRAQAPPELIGLGQPALLGKGDAVSAFGLDEEARFTPIPPFAKGWHCDEGDGESLLQSRNDD
jgi:hypothetical protein